MREDSEMTDTLSTRSFDGVEIPLPGKFEIDSTHSEAGFTARHMMVAKVRGRFEKLSGTIEIAEDVTQSVVEATIDATTIHTRDETRDNHIRSADFLDVEHYPTITFRSTAVRPRGRGAFDIEGDLTIRGITKSVVLDTGYEGVIQDPYGKQRIGLSATTEIDREAFGVSFGAVMEAGGAVVGKIVKIEIEIEATRI
jgi:polyisoprenoid-binding protein YceI